jgi:hypothetical protein
MDGSLTSIAQTALCFCISQNQSRSRMLIGMQAHCTARSAHIPSCKEKIGTSIIKSIEQTAKGFHKYVYNPIHEPVLT